MDKPWWKGHKIIWCVIALFLAFVAAISLNNIGFFNQQQNLAANQSSSLPPLEYATYTNAKFDFSLCYPKNFLFPKTTSSYTDGITLDSQDGSVEAAAFGLNSGPGAFGGRLNNLWTELQYDEGFLLDYYTSSSITDLVTSTDSFSLFLTSPSSSYYQETVMKYGELHDFTFEYPAQEAATYGPLKDAMAKCFSVGSLSGATQYAPPSEENKALCSSISYSSPTADEIKYNTEISKDEFVQYLRRSINDFLDNNYVTSTCSYTGLLNGTHCADFGYDESNDTGSALFSESAGVLGGRFIVLETDPAPGGGESIVLMLKNQPDEIFYAWVYDYTNSDSAATGTITGYDLRALDQYTSEPGSDTPSISETQHAYIDQLCGPNMGI